MQRFHTAFSQFLTLLSSISLRTLHFYLVLHTFDENFEESLLFVVISQYSAGMANKDAIENDVLFQKVTQAYSEKRNPSASIRIRT